MNKQWINRAGAAVGGAVLAGLLGAAGCQTVKSQIAENVTMIPGTSAALFGLNVDVSRPFLIGSAEVAGGHGFFTHPVVWRTSESRIALAYHFLGDTPPGGHDPEAGMDWPMYSDDGGTNWVYGDPMEWPAGPPGVPTFVRKGESYREQPFHFRGATVRLPDGRYLCHRANLELKYGNTYVPQVWSDGGNQWHGPTNALLHFPNFGSPLYLMPHGTVMADGSIIISGYGDAPPVLGGPQVAVFKSTDGGHVFEWLATVATTNNVLWGNEGPTENSVVALPNGELFMVIRTGSYGSGDELKKAAYLLGARSTDGGVTWKHERMRISGVWPQLRLMENGVLVLGYGRPGNYMAFSVDNGRTWIRQTAMSSAMYPTSGYLGLIQVGPNRLLAVYDQYHTYLEKFYIKTPKLVNAMYGRFIDVNYSRSESAPAN